MRATDQAAGAILTRAAQLVGPDSYSRHAVGAVCNPDTREFSLSGLLERANCRALLGGMGVQMPRGDPVALAAAKAALCRHLGAAHLDDWESRQRPGWQAIK